MTPATPLSLHEAIDREKWRAELSSYIYIMMGLHAATRSDWARVKDCIQRLGEPSKLPVEGSLGTLAVYLNAVYQQGVGNLEVAMRQLEDPRLAINAAGKPSSAEDQAESGISLLAALNRLLIMQVERLRDDGKTNELVEQLHLHCADHPDPDVRTAYNLTMSSAQLAPPLSIAQIKRHLQVGLQGAQITNNTHFLSIALNIMRYRLFENVIGDQAVKSAKAGSAQAKKAGNLLWMSVADGMLAESHDVQGQAVEATAAFEAATRYANESWDRTQ